ncbi:MAG: gamma-glutamyl hercynylcysteine S-oxide synthase [Solirubrobacteraceae bacterium]|nr:gamma-glutamyl hercynylcysteine S-oxide synthase [Solirubrobacteraceae bacterium]
MLLREARERTLRLVAPIAVADLERVQSKLMSPLVWDLGHIAAFEDLWLCHLTGGLEPLHPELMEVYDATETPRARRGEIPYLRHGEALEYLSAVRDRALGVLEGANLSRDGDFVWEMVLEHEHQHNETMLQCMQLAERGVVVQPRPARTPITLERAAEMVRVDGGPFLMGDDGTGFAYDNERPRHEVDVATFEIDRFPVTNGAYLAFVDDGGYARRENWTEEGWAWRREASAERPLFWDEDGTERRFERVERLDPNMPVTHVSWFEADAYARWASKRLPTEAEWEKAASWGPGAGRPRLFPWGDEAPAASLANLDLHAFGPLPAGALPRGASAYGVMGLIGDVWEWTSSDFGGYPGFRAYPYREYSEVFFGDRYKVLRGGSWATRPSVARNTFRNWDLPQRRQIFSGFRCARDA